MHDPAMPHIVVVGPGGIGGTFAALLAGTGRARVTVVGRSGPHLDAIAEHGLQLIGAIELTANVTAVADGAALSDCDGLLIAVKAQDTPRALAQVAHIEVRHFVASLQNGVDKDEALVRVFGRDLVMGMVAIVAGEKADDGVVRLTFDGLTQAGELDGSSSDRVDDLVALLTAAGLNVEPTDRITASTWTKMVGWIPIGLFATLGKLTNAQIMSDPVIARSYVEMIRELTTLAGSRGIEPVDLGPFHIASWNEGSIDEAVARIIVSPLASSGSRHSALSDVEAGRPTELAAILGPMINDADERGVQMPVTRAMYAALMGLEKGM